MTATELPAVLGEQLRALGWFALPEDEARQALTWKRRCEDRDERIARLCRAVAGLRVKNADVLADVWDAAQRAFCNDMYAHAAHQDCDDPGECPSTPNPYRSAP